jgi:hypothetical protein
MIKTVTEIINGNEYVITTFSAIKGNLILFKLIKYLRGGAELFNSLSESKSVLDSDVAIGNILEKIIEDVDPEELNNFLCSLLENVSFKNKFMSKDIIDKHFAGNYIEMYKLLIAIIKANYVNEGTKSFFAQARQKFNPQTLAQPAEKANSTDIQKD